jgi:hypothetical protein
MSASAALRVYATTVASVYPLYLAKIEGGPTGVAPRPPTLS